MGSWQLEYTETEEKVFDLILSVRQQNISYGKKHKSSLYFSSKAEEDVMTGIVCLLACLFLLDLWHEIDEFLRCCWREELCTPAQRYALDFSPKGTCREASEQMQWLSLTLNCKYRVCTKELSHSSVGFHFKLTLRTTCPRNGTI